VRTCEASELDPISLDRNQTKPPKEGGGSPEEPDPNLTWDGRDRRVNPCASPATESASLRN